MKSGIRISLIAFLISIFSFGYVNIGLADQNSNNQSQYTDNINYVDTNDPMVISVANFAVQQIGRGSLNSIIVAQTAGINDLIYILLLDLVDAHVIHHHYEVQVFVPKNKDLPWKVIYFSPVNF